MTLKLSISLSRKVGEPNYGSRGATVGLEMEAESTLVQQPLELQRRIVQLFRLARQSVDRELAGHHSVAVNETPSNGATASGEPSVRRATSNQVRAIHALARWRELDVASELQERFGVGRPDDLSLVQASEMIDFLKADPTSAVEGG